MTTRRREPAEVRFEIVEVTRAIAKGWLDSNVARNRAAKPRQIKRYVADMTHEPSRWLITGDTIKRTADGETIDGGQRLRAALAAFDQRPDLKSIRMAVAFNVPFDAIYVTDKGARRTFADSLKIEEDAVNTNQAGAIVRRVHVWKQGNYADMRGSNAAFEDPTDTELLEFYRRHRGEFDAATARGRDMRDHKIGNSTAAGTAFFLLREVNDSGAWAFFDHLITGADLPAKSPILALRDRLWRAGQVRGRAGTGLREQRSDALTATEQLFLYIRAWNAFRADESLDRLILPSKGITNRNFPKPE